VGQQRGKGENKNQINGNLIHSTCHFEAMVAAVFVEIVIEAT